MSPTIIARLLNEVKAGRTSPTEALAMLVMPLRDPEVVELALCEAGRVMPRPGVLYRFTVRPGCKACAEAEAPYLANSRDEPRRA